MKMIPKTLEEIASHIVKDGKGILAADESTGTIEKRFKSIDVESTEDNRRKYREMLFRSPAMAEAIGGVILFDETLRQKAQDGSYLRDVILKHGSLPGIKVDQGVKELEDNSNEKITTGLNGLNERCREYDGLGAKFTKWRAVININDTMPSTKCINENMLALSEYALIAQENNMVPIVEPEVIMDGPHTIDQCYNVTKNTLSVLFEMLDKKNVNIRGTLLKPNMVVSGTENSHQANFREVAEKTLECLNSSVPDELPGIVFLSGGQSDINATAHLDEMNKIGGFKWKLSFSYGRALQQAALKAWEGDDNKLEHAQKAFGHRAIMNMKASLGEWSESLEV
jgi:fructose-bisphosphate aldolase class I